MGRILCIDYGLKRCGIAVTDVLQISVNPLTTVKRLDLHEWLDNYIKNEEVEMVVMGYPLQTDGTENQIVQQIKQFEKEFLSKHQLEFHYEDERYSSKDAMELMIRFGVKKMKRREKGIMDKFAAAVILERFMENKRN